ncbi:MAG: hypothetical protein Q4G70_09765 [Pseudomonadota bacterium]|nr:hypothetical protein [Pseudomonadota bacterium]
MNRFWKKFIKIILVASGILAGFQPLSINAQEISRNQAEKNSPACPSKNFNDFLKAFRNNNNFQKIFTITPLKYSYLDDDQNKKNILLEGSEVDFPIIESTKKLKQEGIKIKITIKKPNAFVDEWQEGTGWRKTYIFNNKKGCWHLISVDDQST